MRESLKSGPMTVVRSCEHSPATRTNAIGQGASQYPTFSSLSVHSISTL